MRTWSPAAIDKKECVPAPSMIMALGIYLQFAGPYLLARLGVDQPTLVLTPAVYGLLLLSVVIFATLAIRFARQPSALLEPIAENFSIGTWAASSNVLAATLLKLTDRRTLGGAFNTLGWLCWIHYMVWFIKAARGRRIAVGINGSAFLTTVSTQSVVSSLDVWTLGHRTLPLFLGLNFLGLAFYGYIFFHVWIAAGVRSQVKNWIAPNNITPGALSITVLAQQLLYLAAPKRFPFLVWLINGTWALAVLLFLGVIVVELWILRSVQRSRVLAYRMSNFARNFTYGMFFACTYLGHKRIPRSLMANLVTPAPLLTVAALVTAVNLWEISNQVRHYLSR